MKKIFFALLLTLSAHKIYPGLFSSYDKKSPEDNVRDLAIEQINSPDDPYINYNLGVALYQTRKYDSAKNNFERAVANAKNKKLKERSYFNLANSCYKSALSGLPVNWESESTKIEQDKLAAAIENTKQAVKNYENLLMLNKKNEQAKINLKKAKDLLEKLIKKQPQNKQGQKDQKDSKDQQSQQNQEDHQGQKDQSKQDKQDQQQKQDGQQDKSQDKSSEQEEKQDKGQAGEQKQDSGQEQKQDQGQAGEQKQDSGQEEKQFQELNESQQQAAQQAQAQQALGQEGQKESAEEKSMRLMLENLQSDEDNLQKLIIQRQTKDQKPLQSGQKPW